MSSKQGKGREEEMDNDNIAADIESNRDIENE